MQATQQPTARPTVTLAAIVWPASAWSLGSLTAVVDGQPYYVTIGLDDGAVAGWHGVQTAAYVVDVTGDLTAEQWDAIEHSVGEAYAEHCGAERAA